MTCPNRTVTTSAGPPVIRTAASMYTANDRLLRWSLQIIYIIVYACNVIHIRISRYIKANSVSFYEAVVPALELPRNDRWLQHTDQRDKHAQAKAHKEACTQSTARL